MKLSCLPVSYFEEIINNKKSIHDWVSEAREIGFDYADLSILFFQKLDEKYILDIRNDLDKLNIDIAIINTYTDFTHPSPVKRKNELLKLKDYIDAAYNLKARYVRVTSGQAHPETSKNNGIKWAIENILEAAEYAKDTSLQILFENHSKPGIWDYWDFCFQPDIFLEIYRHIKDSQIKILFDTANILAYGDNPLNLLEKIVDNLACIHAADTEANGIFKPVVIGMGAVPFKEIFIKLKEYNFDGIISIEEASFTKRKGIETAYKYIKDMWQKYGQ